LTIVSVNVGMPREVRWRGGVVSTAIFKEPVSRRVGVLRMNIEGDRQADPSVHGGSDKAVYAYAAEHYDAWKKELGRTDLPWGMFGENLTIAGGFTEETIQIGDRFRAGTAELLAVQPRLPCFKLGIRFGTQRIIRQFARSERFGVYFRVLQEGTVACGDTVALIATGRSGLSIRDLGRLLMKKRPDQLLMEQAVAIEALPESLRRHFRSRLL
jgi:MOSC domain-containing protein YiiM